jgi:hypothetical protein
MCDFSGVGKRKQRDERGLSEDGAQRLGIVTRTSSPIDSKGVFDSKTGEYLPVESVAVKGEKNRQLIVKENHSAKSRSDRWSLKYVVNEILPKTRVSKCMVLRAPDNVNGGLRDIEVCKSDSRKKAFYHGLYACGDVWNCPICAAKVSERRRQELKLALVAAKQQGFKSHFVTLTFPHGISDDLNEILPKMTKAYGKLSNGKYSVKNELTKISPNAEIHGFIRAVEVTHGKNGFHPHVHMIVFTSADVSSKLLENVYSDAWIRACRLSKLPAPHPIHGCTVKDGSFAAEYASKWGIEDEMTKANQKKARGKKGITPWGLLRCIKDGDDDEYSPERAKPLFLVYSHAFKNKRQLYWSNGLRRLLAMGEVEMSDKELADKKVDELAKTLAVLSVEQWKEIRAKKMESLLLEVAEESGGEMLGMFISNSIGLDNFEKLPGALGREPLAEGVPQSPCNEHIRQRSA